MSDEIKVPRELLERVEVELDQDADYIYGDAAKELLALLDTPESDVTQHADDPPKP